MIKTLLLIGFYAALAIISTMQGYYLDKGDLVFYIPFAFHAFDPSLFSNDLIIQTIPAHPVFIWKFLGLAMHVVNFELLFGIVFGIQTVFIIGALLLFYRNFFGPDIKGIAIFLLFMILPTSTPAFGRLGINPYGYFHASALAMAFTLVVFVLLKKEKWVIAGALTGSIFLFHPITAVFTSIVFFWTFVLRLKERKPIWTFLLGWAVLLLVASPSLVQQVTGVFNSHVGKVDLELWRTVVVQRMGHGLFISKWPPERFIQIAVMLFAVFFIRRKYPVKNLFPILLSIFTALAICTIADLFTVRLFLQLQLGRQLLFAWVLGYAAVAFLLSYQWQNGSESHYGRTKYVLCVLFAAYCAFGHAVNDYHGAVRAITITCILLAVAASAMSFRMRSGWIVVLISLSLPVFALSTIESANYISHKNDFPDSIHNSWRDVQEWCRNNTPENAVIMTPFYREGFRCYSHRAIYASFKDGAPHNFSNVTFPEWLRRMNVAGACLPFDKKNFVSLYHDNCLAAARKENLRFVVVERNFFKDVSVSFAYQNNDYGVIDMTHISNALNGPD